MIVFLVDFVSTVVKSITLQPCSKAIIWYFDYPPVFVGQPGHLTAI